MSRSRIALAASLAVAIAATGCTVAKAQVEVTQMCVTYAGVQIAGVDPGTTTLDHTFTYDKLGPIQNLISLVSDLEFVSMDAHAVTGVTDFDFVQAAHVTVASGDPSSTLPTLDVYDCDGDCVPVGDSLTVPSTLEQSAIEYVESGSVIVDLQIAGQLPVDDWTMNVDACFQGQLAYEQSL